MTKDELLKRLVRIEASPPKNVPPPRDNMRREFGKIDLNPEPDLSEFDPFDFEKEVDDLKPARDQAELITEPSQPVETFMVLEEDFSNVKSGDSESFFLLDEEFEKENELEPTINNSIEDIVIVEPSSEEAVNGEDLNNISGTEEVSLILDEKLNQQEVLVNTFKICKYIKEGGVSCKRQAPKTSDYCSSHRKVLAKEEK